MLQEEITIPDEPEAKPTMSAEDEEVLVRRIMNDEVDPDTPIEPTQAPDTAQAPDTQVKPDASAQQTPATQTGEQPGEVAETLETIREKLKTLEERYANATKKIGEQGAELGRYRTQQPQAAPVLPFPNLQPPMPRMPQPPGAAPAQEPFDFTDPNHVRREARNATVQTVQEILAQERQREAQAKQQQFMQNWFADTTGAKARLAAEKGVPEQVIDEAQTQFMQDFMAGKLPEMAYSWRNLQSIIQDAEKRGEAAAIARLQAAQNAPKRAAAASSATATQAGKLEDMSPQDIKQLMNKLDPDSEQYEKLGRYLMRFET